MLLVLRDVLEPAELEQIRTLLAGATFKPGERTGGAVARRVKQNEQVAADSDAGRALAAVVVGALQRNALFRSATLYERTTQPLFNRYAPGMTYGAHVDNAFMANGVRSDIAVTLFVSDPADYDGGELTVEDAFGPRALKLAAGSLVAYPASSVHRVQPVTRGVRDAAIVWLQSLVRAPERRRLLFDLDMTINALRNRDPEAPEIVRLNATYHNLLREWAGS